MRSSWVIDRCGSLSSGEYDRRRFAIALGQRALSISLARVEGAWAFCDRLESASVVNLSRSERALFGDGCDVLVIG